MPNSLSLVLVSFGALCKVSNFTIFETPLLSQFSSDSSKLYTMYHIHAGCHFFGDQPKIAKNYGILKFSLSRTCCYNFQSAISPTFFIGVHPNFITALGTTVNLNACYNLRSWHLVPKIRYSIQNFSKHSCVLGLQFKQIVKAPGPLVIL